MRRLTALRLWLALALLLSLGLASFSEALTKGWGATKPPVGVQINWGHPLARGLVAYWLFNEGGGSPTRTDLGTSPTTAVGPLTWQPSPGRFGIEAKGSATADFRYPIGSREKVARPFTVIAGLRFTTSSNLVVAEINANTGWSLQVGQPGANRVALNVNNSVFGTNTANNTGLVQTHVAVAMSGADAWYVDGVSDVTGTSGEPNYGAATELNVFSRNGAVAYTDSILFLGLFQGAWSQGRAQWLHAEPYAFLLWPVALSPSTWAGLMGGAPAALLQRSRTGYGE